MMDSFVKKIKDLEEAIGMILKLKEGEDLVVSGVLEEELEKADLGKSKPIEMSSSHPYIEPGSCLMMPKPEDLVEPTFYDQEGVWIASSVTLREGANFQANSKEEGYKLYLLKDGSLAVFSYLERKKPTEDGAPNPEGADREDAIITYNARLKKQVLPKNIITATDKWVNTICINPNDPYFVLSSEDPSKCIYCFRPEMEQNEDHSLGQTQESFRFDRDYLARTIRSALASEDKKAAAIFRGEHAHGFCAGGGLVPKLAEPNEREVDIYMMIDISQSTHRYEIGEVTAPYLVERLAECGKVMVLKPTEDAMRKAM